MVYKRINGNLEGLHFLVNGVNKVSLTHQPENIISYVARIDRWKQQHLAIEAFAKTEYARKNYTLKIAGPIYDDKYNKELMALISKLGLENSVQLLGSLSRENTDKLLVKSSLTLSLYNTSNFGNVFIESLQNGVPILSCNINGSLDYVDEDCYIQLDNYDVESIALRLDSVLKDKKYLEELSTNSVNFSKKAFVSWSDRAALEVDILLNS
nr:glycosyltransferase [Shewanella algae]